MNTPRNNITALSGPSFTPIVVTKTARSVNPMSEPCSWDQWVQEGINASSPPVDYEVRGFLIKPPAVGDCMHLLRTHRNGIRADGVFSSTPICSIRTCDGGFLIETHNSIYRIRPDLSLLVELAKEIPNHPPRKA